MIVIVPIKALVNAKSRLSSMLSALERKELALQLLNGVLGACAAAQSVSRIIVLTPDATIVDNLGHFLLDIMVDPDEGLNPAIAATVAGLQPAGPQEILILHADLPLVTSADIDAVARTGAPGDVVIAASGDGGTNALRFPPGSGLQPGFGPDSAARHREGARRLGLPYRILVRPGLALDIDNPEDILGWRREVAA